MPYKIQWLDDKKTIIYMAITEPIEMNGWIEMNLMGIEMAKGVVYPVFFLREHQTTSGGLPKGVFQYMSDLAKLSEGYPPNLKSIIEVGAHSRRRFIHQIFVRIYGKGRLVFTETMDEALQWIEKEKEAIRYSVR